MKYILKQVEPATFNNWKAKRRTYERFKKTAKIRNAVKNALTQEQGHLCCYCERRITLDDSHIEHFYPRSNPAVDPLNYANMLCSCQKELTPGEPRHCGNAKANCDAELLVSPMTPTCEDRFTFTADGHIQPAHSTDLAAVKTIDQLQLNIPKLRALREGAITPFLDPTLSDTDLKLFVKGYLTTDSAGQFGEFWTTIQSLFGGIL